MRGDAGLSLEDQGIDRMSWDRIHVDLHTHTSFSCDSVLPPAVLVEQAAAAGLERVAVTDHNEIEGALEARALDPHRVCTVGVACT